MGSCFILFIGLLALCQWRATLALPQKETGRAVKSSSSYWLKQISHSGTVAFGNNSNYKVFRNVMDYGAKGDGSTDDTDAINSAVADGNRCGQGCTGSTTTPALVYFPPGNYLVSRPIVQLYYTQFVGDAVNPPTLTASSSFEGIAVIDADPYDNSGNNYWINQNNFFRQVRNFVIDLTRLDESKGAGIHWQVAQATSLQNIVFNMHQSSSASNSQKGIFMDNGSGGWMSDLVFNGGSHGAFFGNQQFTSRNLSFNNCQTAIFMNWNWAWTLQDIRINNCGVGIDMSVGGATRGAVGSVLLVDSTIANTPVGIKTAYSPGTMTNGTLILDNVDMSTNVATAIFNNATSSAILAGNQKIASFVQGNMAGSGTSQKAVQGSASAVSKPDELMSGSSFFARSKPQYADVAAGSLVSVKAGGAKGDGVTDDTAAIQHVLNKATADQVVLFDHGAYLVTDTIKVPKNIRITGEAWPMIMAAGNGSTGTFSDIAHPKPVFQVGQVGDTGAVELSDLLFSTVGPQPGAILMEWNIKQSSQGAAGMWDVHFRVGGSKGTQLQLPQCAKNPNATNAVSASCYGVFLMMHVTSQSSIYLENNHFWVADHDMEPEANNQQIDIFSGRGVLVESQGPVWMLGTASEHSQLYNYQLSNAANVYMGLIQTETPYFQANPDATKPFAVNTAYNDPDFSTATDAKAKKSWGLRVTKSSGVFVYGAGLYSFFDNYNQTCLETENCQTNMASIEDSSVTLFALNTKAAFNMLTVDGNSVALDSANRGVYTATLAKYVSIGSGSANSSTATASASSLTAKPNNSTTTSTSLNSSGASGSSLNSSLSSTNTSSFPSEVSAAAVPSLSVSSPESPPTYSSTNCKRSEDHNPKKKMRNLLSLGWLEVSIAL